MELASCYPTGAWGCFTKNLPYFGRHFFRLMCTDTTKYTHNQRLNGYGDNKAKNVIFLRFHLLYLFKITRCPYTTHVRP